jgi:glutaredoxin
MAKAIVWTNENCPKCDAVKAALKAQGVEIEERPAAGLTNGDEFNPKALKMLAAQNYATPLVCVDEKFFPKDHKF